ncbi:MAG TPA: bifunctional riboflavin kinase/FAD synthetase [Acidobacteriota bacterium]|nr:bifunctional riboflavin kinase/FAD synthetase [Acidobacteriota bacterium]
MKVLYRLEELPHGHHDSVATIGNFDGVHLGHQRLMCDLAERAATVRGTPTVITFHPHPLQVLAPNNAPRQIQTLDQKLSTIASLGIELVIIIPFDVKLARTSARDFVNYILCDKLHLMEIHVGPNFAFGYRREGSFNLLKEIGEERGFLVGKIHQVQFRGSRVSSTAIRQALVAGQVGLARRLLGRPYSLEGTIVHGTATGAGLRVPTANLETANELIPRNGVYVTLSTIDGRQHKSVTNIGIRPTISGGAADRPVSIESHVLDFHEDIYGRKVALEFLVRLRDEHRFPDTGALAAQIRNDVRRARRFFIWLERARVDV